MTEMIERMAKAIFDAWAGDRRHFHGVPWDEMPDGMKDDCRDAARAAIEAMRKPTMSMKLAGAPAISAQMPKRGVQANYDAADDGWQAMIEDALTNTREGA